MDKPQTATQVGERQARHTSEIWKHIALVREFMEDIITDLERRAREHDLSKFQEPEYSGYMGLNEAVKGHEYGSMAYIMAFAPFKDVIKHHYEHNDHHPEHFDRNFSQMDLLQIAEMLADWKAASMRGGDAKSLFETLEKTIKHQKVPDAIAHLLRNTVAALEW